MSERFHTSSIDERRPATLAIPCEVCKVSHDAASGVVKRDGVTELRWSVACPVTRREYAVSEPYPPRGPARFIIERLADAFTHPPT